MDCTSYCVNIMTLFFPSAVKSSEFIKNLIKVGNQFDTVYSALANVGDTITDAKDKVKKALEKDNPANCDSETKLKMFFRRFTTSSSASSNCTETPFGTVSLPLDQQWKERMNKAIVSFPHRKGNKEVKSNNVVFDVYRIQYNNKQAQVPLVSVLLRLFNNVVEVLRTGDKLIDRVDHTLTIISAFALFGVAVPILYVPAPILMYIVIKNYWTVIKVLLEITGISNKISTKVIAWIRQRIAHWSGIVIPFLKYFKGKVSKRKNETDDSSDSFLLCRPKSKMSCTNPFTVKMPSDADPAPAPIKIDPNDLPPWVSDENDVMITRAPQIDPHGQQERADREREHREQRPPAVYHPRIPAH